MYHFNILVIHCQHCYIKCWSSLFEMLNLTCTNVQSLILTLDAAHTIFSKSIELLTRRNKNIRNSIHTYVCHVASYVKKNRCNLLYNTWLWKKWAVVGYVTSSLPNFWNAYRSSLQRPANSIYLPQKKFLLHLSVFEIRVTNHNP